jgi:uncharacterized YccA/Bax inhibitor family protein
MNPLKTPVARPGAFSMLMDKTAHGAPLEQAGMSVRGAIGKTAILWLIAMAVAGVTWSIISLEDLPVFPIFLVGVAGAGVSAGITCFRQGWAPFTGPLYACFEGVLFGVGAIFLDRFNPGTSFLVGGLSSGILMATFALYYSGGIYLNNKVQSAVLCVIAGLSLSFFVVMILSRLGMSASFLYHPGFIGLAVSLLLGSCVALNLILDLDSIEEGARCRAPKYMEWYSAFAALISFMWLCMEFFRVVSDRLRRS